MTTRAGGWCGSSAGQRVGGDLAAGADGPAVRARLRILLREEGVTYQRLKTWKASKDMRYAEKKARVEQLYAVADRESAPQAGTRRSSSAWTSPGR